MPITIMYTFDGSRNRTTVEESERPRAMALVVGGTMQPMLPSEVSAWCVSLVQRDLEQVDAGPLEITRRYSTSAELEQLYPDHAPAGGYSAVLQPPNAFLQPRKFGSGFSFVGRLLRVPNQQLSLPSPPKPSGCLYPEREAPFPPIQ